MIINRLGDCIVRPSPLEASLRQIPAGQSHTPHACSTFLSSSSFLLLLLLSLLLLFSSLSLLSLLSLLSSPLFLPTGLSQCGRTHHTLALACTHSMCGSDGSLTPAFVAETQPLQRWTQITCDVVCSLSVRHHCLACYLASLKAILAVQCA